jgi:colicin import membrane protein
MGVEEDEAAKAEREAERAELEALRKEKSDQAAAQAEAEKAEREAERAELAEHRKEKTERDAAAALAAKKTTAPVKKAEKAPVAGDEGQPKPKARVSRKWFGSAADED